MSNSFIFFFNPEFNAKIITPKTTGIRAVGE